MQNFGAKIYSIITLQRRLLNIDLGNFGNIQSDANIILTGLKISIKLQEHTKQGQARTNQGQTMENKQG